MVSVWVISGVVNRHQAMETTVLCPDCGGVIGGNGQDGRKPCTCELSRQGSLPGMPNPPSKVRVCCKCGKDLQGKKRFKDSLGYWCEACHYTEKREEKSKHVPCDACGRYVEPRHLTQYENIKICTRCLKERKRQQRRTRRPTVFGQEHRAMEKKEIVRMALVALILLVIIILASMKIL